MRERKRRLELTWIGKEERPRVEPRILLEDAERSYRAEKRVGDRDIFDNRLIHGDNLLGLKALEAEFTGRLKCIVADPPFNTQQAFTDYNDGLEHSLWVSLMRDRVEVFRTLLADDGVLWVIIDENEAHYLKVLCDEVFGRSCFVTTVIWRTTDNSNNNATGFSLDHNHILVYGKVPDWRPRLLNDQRRRGHFRNPDNDPRGPWFDGNPVNNPALRPNLQFELETPSGKRIPSPPNGWRWSPETIAEKLATGELRFSDDETRLIRRTYLRDMEGLPPSSLWSDIEETGHNRQAKYELKKLFPNTPVTSLFSTPKPERLIARILELSTVPGDIVLDSFAGSGTTGAVAHKMGRRWIMVEIGEHCYSTVIPRLQKVISGQDGGGISEQVAWRGGGGFRYFKLAPSLLEKDEWGNWIVSRKYHPEMLAEAMCKLEGFRYAPDPDVFWIHGKSTERDFIYVTTQNLGHEQLRFISEQVGTERTLLICCSAFRAKKGDFANLTLQKIPQAVLSRCEWGRDDYSLNVQELPPVQVAEDMKDDGGTDGNAGRGGKGSKVEWRRRKGSAMQELPLFAGLGKGGEPR